MDPVAWLPALGVAHVVVLGYWLGSELVINSTFRYVCWRGDMAFDERSRLMGHVMNVDQHVRYALVLQVMLGLALMALLGLAPGGTTTFVIALALGCGWLVLVEVTHRRRHDASGARLAGADRALRYVAIIAFAGAAVAAAAGAWVLPTWLTWKLALFAGVIACGLGIRFALMDFFSVWREIADEGSTPAREARVRHLYVRATSVLGVLWGLILAITLLSIVRP